LQVLPRDAHPQGYSTPVATGVRADVGAGAATGVGADVGACSTIGAPYLGTNGFAAADSVLVVKRLLIIEVNIDMFTRDDNIIFLIVC
jgi:hypothetical protein